MTKPFFEYGPYETEVECSVCLVPWTDAAELLPCCHIFCSMCFASTGGKQCPTCRAHVQSTRKPNRILINIVSEIQGSCGVCKWKGSRGTFFESHMKSCPGPKKPPSRTASNNDDDSQRRAAMLAPPTPPPRQHSDFGDFFAAADAQQQQLTAATRGTVGTSTPSQPSPSPMANDSFSNFFQVGAAAPPQASATAVAAPPPTQQQQQQGVALPFRDALAHVEKRVDLLETQMQLELDNAARNALSRNGGQSQGGICLDAKAAASLVSLANARRTDVAELEKFYAGRLTPAECETAAALRCRVEGCAKVINAARGGGGGEGGNRGLEQQGSGDVEMFLSERDMQRRQNGTDGGAAATAGPRHLPPMPQAGGEAPWEQYNLGQTTYDMLVSSFHLFDANGTGRLNEDEAKRLFLWLNLPAESEALRPTIFRSDKDFCSVDDVCRWAKAHSRRPMVEYGLTFDRYWEGIYLFHSLDPDLSGYLSAEAAINFVERFTERTHLAAVELLQATITAHRTRGAAEMRTATAVDRKASGGLMRRMSTIFRSNNANTAVPPPRPPGGSQAQVPVRITIHEVLSVINSDNEGWDTCGVEGEPASDNNGGAANGRRQPLAGQSGGAMTNFVPPPQPQAAPNAQPQATVVDHQRRVARSQTVLGPAVGGVPMARPVTQMTTATVVPQLQANSRHMPPQIHQPPPQMNYPPQYGHAPQPHYPPPQPHHPVPQGQPVYAQQHNPHRQQQQQYNHFHQGPPPPRQRQRANTCAQQ